MFVPQGIDLTIYKGSTFRAGFNLEENGLPFDLSGWSARMQIRESVDSDVVVLELTTENGGITFTKTTSNDGTVTSAGYQLYLSPAQTADVTVSGGVYDIELVDVEGDVGRIQSGSVMFDPEVTR